MLNKSAINSQSIADFGAQRILGTSGSLTGYINTGNPYDPQYYKKNLPNDKFEKKSSNKTKGKAFAIGASILALGTAAIAILKKKGTNFKGFSSLGDKVKKLLPQSLKVSEREDYICKALEHYRNYVRKHEERNER